MRKSEANVHTRKKRQTSTEPTTAKSHGKPVALEYSAILPARLALMRWTRGGDVPHVVTCASLAARAAWYDTLQSNFQDWLQAGGMHRPEPAKRPQVILRGDVKAETPAVTAESANIVEPK